MQASLATCGQKIFWQTEFIAFQGCPTEQAAFLPGRTTSKNQLFIQTLLLVPECSFA